MNQGRDAHPTEDWIDRQAFEQGASNVRKSEKVREVYAELKAVFSEDMTAREILECASLMVEATEESLYEPALPSQQGRLPFSQLPVHVVFEDWSWRILNREVIWEDGYSPHISEKDLIEHCLQMAA